MTLNIDFTPQETAWLNAQAQQQGLLPAEIIRKMVEAHLHTAPAQTAMAPVSAPVLDAKQQAAIAFLNARIAEGLAADPETKRQAEEELAEFKRNINANRTATGDHPVYP